MVMARQLKGKMAAKSETTVQDDGSTFVSAKPLCSAFSTRCWDTFEKR